MSDKFDVRTCNKWKCGGIMRPTRELYLSPWMEEYDDATKEDFMLRWYRCVECGNRTRWKDKPKKGDTSAARLHKFMYREGWCSISWSSDPNFVAPIAPPVGPFKIRRHRGPEDEHRQHRNS